MINENERCGWAKKELDIEYHDTQWGKPCYDDDELFEMLILEGFQAGLSWTTILNKRENFRKAFDKFNYKKIAKYNEKKFDELMLNEGIIRNKLKIHSSAINANKFMEVQSEFGSFSKYLWGFVDNKPIINKWKTLQEVPASTELSDKISKDMKKRGFKFVSYNSFVKHQFFKFFLVIFSYFFIIKFIKRFSEIFSFIKYRCPTKTRLESF